MKHSSDHVDNFPVDTMEEASGLGMLHSNNKTRNCDQGHKASAGNCHFLKVKESAEEDDDEYSDDRIELLVYASVDSHEDTKF